MNKALKYSVIAHSILIFLFIFKLPSFNDPLPQEKTITVSLVKVGQETNLTNLSNTKTKSMSESTTKANPPQSPKKIIKIIDKEKKLVVKTPKNIFTKKEDINELDSLLQEMQKNSNFGKKSKDLAKSDKPYNSGHPLTISERDNIKYQIEKKLVNPLGFNVKPGEIVIKLRLEMKSNGEVFKVIESSESRYKAQYFQAYTTLKSNLIRAVHMASPLENLPIEKYDTQGGWSEIELAFDAHYLTNY